MRKGESVTLLSYACSREDFLNALDMALLMDEVRINKGTYKITIRKFTKKEEDTLSDTDCTHSEQDVTGYTLICP